MSTNSRPRRIAIVTLSGSHLNATSALAREALRRGHDVRFFTTAPGKRDLAGKGSFPCHEFGTARLTPERLHSIRDEISRATGLRALLATGAFVRERIAAALEDLPDLVQSYHPDFIVSDQAAPEGGAVADALRIPWLTISPTLVMNQHPDVPPYFTGFMPMRGIFGRLRNQSFNTGYNLGLSGAVALLNAFRAAHGVRPETPGDLGISPLGQLLNQHRGFEFPREDLSESCHFVGPMIDDQRPPLSDFPYHLLDRQRPLVYASFGTVQNQHQGRIRIAAKALAQLDATSVISLGRADPETLGPLPDNIVAVRMAPQLEILQRADCFVTHAGMNGAMESLALGVPMVAIPITNDQPGIAARIAFSRTGIRIRPSALTAGVLRSAVETVLRDGTFRANAARHQREILACGRAVQAVDILESVMARHLAGVRDDRNGREIPGP